jgi:RNA polymerase sigma-70 factor (ECF subfamily)
MSTADAFATSITLLGRLTDPDNRDAWACFVERYRPLIRHWCRDRGLPAPDGEDVAQAVLLKLVQSLSRGGYQPEKGKFRSYLKTIVRNAIVDHWRQSRRAGAWEQAGLVLEQLAAPDSIDPLASELSDQVQEEHDRVRTALRAVERRVKPNTWQAFWLLTVEGRAGKEAAEQLGMTVTAVHVANCRVRELLRAEMARLARESASP